MKELYNLQGLPYSIKYLFKISFKIKYFQLRFFEARKSTISSAFFQIKVLWVYYGYRCKSEMPLCVNESSLKITTIVPERPERDSKRYISCDPAYKDGTFTRVPLNPLSD